MLPILPIVIGGAIVAGATAVCSSWESENEEAEAELEERRARYRRTIQRRRLRLERNRKMKAAILNLAATKRQLAFAEGAARIAQRYLDVGSGQLDEYKRDIHVLISNEIAVPAQAAAFEQQYLANVKDMSSTCRKCKRQVANIRKRLSEIANAKFYFTCARCHRRFAVKVGDLEKFKSTKVNGKAYCLDCRG